MVIRSGARSLLSRHPVPAPADLVNVPWVEEFGSDEVAGWLGRLGVVGRMPGHILSLPAEYALSAIKQGRGVGIVAAAWIEAEIASGELVVLFDALHGEDLGYHLVYPKGRRRPALERFLNWCRAELDRQ